MDNFDQVKGAIFGQAIGDALAHPIEFEKTHEVEDLEDDNTFTDDTQMFCAIGEAMLDAPPHLGVDAFMDALTARFIDWRKNPLGGSHRAPGGTCMEAVRKLGAGRDWRVSGATRDGKGNGSAMRAGIVGARYWQIPSEAFRIGCLTSINTHNNLESILSAGMVSFLVACSIQGNSWHTTVAEGLRLCGEFPYQVPNYPTNTVPLDNTRNGQSPWGAIASFARGFILGESNMTTAEFLKGNGNDFTSVPAVSEAIFFNTRHTDYNVMALDVANRSDDSDTVTAIAGTIAGARWGYNKIVQSWVEKIEEREYLSDLSQRIWDAAQEQHAAALRTQDVDEALGEDYDEGDSGDLAEVSEEEDFEVEF